MRCDSRETLRKLSSVCGEVGDSSDAEDAVRMVAKDVRTIGRKVGRLDHGDGEVFGKVAKHGEFPDPGETSSAIFRGLIDKVDPDEVGDEDGPKDGEGEEEEEDAETDGEQQRPEEHAERLQSTTAWDRDRSKAVDARRKDDQYSSR
ncbi:midasin [Pseudozyma hubeiensis SY62]|uniref:Midasin n=1 Tax=Pseudozyma hubeiensis (strain SY62) TaxID=1305764 RepID=R9PEC8_PSEHS|nr:midasin [Pseudozyma hubeiensis SY62]GAC99612.1 midasin [Pseudozyma hubeiensis SY62]